MHDTVLRSAEERRLGSSQSSLTGDGGVLTEQKTIKMVGQMANSAKEWGGMDEVHVAE